MPHTSTHRGAAPEDARLFAPDSWPTLRAATSDLSWLLSRGYAIPSAAELVGNRYALRDRQRLAVGRCACADAALARRQARCVSPEALPGGISPNPSLRCAPPNPGSAGTLPATVSAEASHAPAGCRRSQVQGEELWLDGYNVLMVLEAALGGGVVLVGRDGCCRDVLGIHGSYHRVQETEPALRLIGEWTHEWGVSGCHWWLDKPVSNSGRLRALILEVAAAYGWNWPVDLVRDPDAVLAASSRVVVTADSAILDRCQRWVNLARAILTRSIPGAKLVDLSGT